MSGAFAKSAFAYRHASMTAASYLVLRTLGWLSDDEGKIAMGLVAIAEECCVTVKTLTTTLTQFQTLGILERTEIRGGRGQTNTYTLRLETVKGLQRKARQETVKSTEETVKSTEETVKELQRKTDVNYEILSRASVNQDSLKRRDTDKTDKLTLTSADADTSVQRKRNDYPDDFEAFWKAYGNEGTKGSAYDAWKKKAEGVSLEKILSAVEAYLASPRPQNGYTQNASTWINGRGWDTDWTRANGGKISEQASRPEQNQKKTADSLAAVRAAVERMNPNGVQHVRGINASAGTGIHVSAHSGTDSGVLEVSDEHIRRRVPRGDQHRDS